MTIGVKKALDAIRDAEPYTRPSRQHLTALRRCLVCVLVEWELEAQTKRTPYRLMEIWNDWCAHQYISLRRQRLDWLGSCVLLSATAGMFGCSYRVDDAKEVRAQMEIVLEQIFGSRWVQTSGRL